MRVGIVGATGPAGMALAARLAAGGVDVLVGSRSLERATGACETVAKRWPERTLGLEPVTNLEAAGGETVVIATPWDSAAETAGSLAKELAGKVVISMANALARIDGQFQALDPPGGSVAVGVAAACPGALVAAAFQHLPAASVADLAHPLAGDVLICSDHRRAHEVTATLVRAMANLRPLDAGGLVSAGPVEALTAVLVGLNVRYRSRASVSLLGISVP